MMPLSSETKELISNAAAMMTPANSLNLCGDCHQALDTNNADVLTIEALHLVDGKPVPVNENDPEFPADAHGQEMYDNFPEWVRKPLVVNTEEEKTSHMQSASEEMYQLYIRGRPIGGPFRFGELAQRLPRRMKAYCSVSLPNPQLIHLRSLAARFRLRAMAMEPILRPAPPEPEAPKVPAHYSLGDPNSPTEPGSRLDPMLLMYKLRLVQSELNKLHALELAGVVVMEGRSIVVVDPLAVENEGLVGQSDIVRDSSDSEESGDEALITPSDAQFVPPSSKLVVGRSLPAPFSLPSTTAVTF